MRGGVFYISERYSKLSNRYLTFYDPKSLAKYFTYLDKNNLYGCIMSKSLLAGRFKWLDPAEFNLIW